MLTPKQVLGVRGIGRIAQAYPLRLGDMQPVGPATPGGVPIGLPVGFVGPPAPGYTQTAPCDPALDPNCLAPGQLDNIKTFYYDQGAAAGTPSTLSTIDWATYAKYGAIVLVGIVAISMLPNLLQSGGRRR